MYIIIIKLKKKKTNKKTKIPIKLAGEEEATTAQTTD